MLQTTLAHNFVLTTAMVAFVNYYAPRMRIPIGVPISEQSIWRLGVTMPECSTNGFLYGGGIQINNYAFGFRDGHFSNAYSHITGCFFLSKFEADGMSSFGIPMLHMKESSSSIMERASRMPYTVGTNDLYQMATNFALALEIDVRSLAKNNQLIVDQGVFHSNRGLVPSPITCAYWGMPFLRDPGSNGFAFEVSAVSGDLVELNVGNSTTCRGFPLIK